ncbi:MAG: hypothetical protein ACYDAG_09815 [Chloroflexota bacterium]
MPEPTEQLGDRYPRRIVDHHLHTATWSDGRLAVADLVEIAQSKGYLIGVSDHAGPGQSGVQAHNVGAYIDELSRYPVYKAVEMDVAYGLPFGIDQAARLDYIIGSLHGVMRDGHYRPLDGMFRWFQAGGTYRPDVDLSDPEVWVDEWLSILERCFSSTPIDILGHPTLTPILPLDADPARAYRPEWEERLCTLALKYGVALEISGRYRLPHERLVRLGRDMGVVFSIGSDGHQRQQICDLTYTLDMIGRVGIPADQIFDTRRKPRSADQLAAAS